MTRRILLPAITAVALTLTCTSAVATTPAATPAPAQRQEKAPEPDRNKAAKGGPEEVRVDDKAIPDRDPVEVQEGMADVIWLGGKGVKNVLVFFKDECKDQITLAKPPVDPPCKGDQCFLERTATAYHLGTHCYTIVVVKNDGTVLMNDPKLIIKPPAR